jgi:AcrR family transcriptional regulator
MKEEKENIVKYTSEILFTFGFNTVTMDSIAQGLRMSKKTLYKYFTSKEDLLDAVIEMVTQKLKVRIETVINSELNAIEKLFNVLKIVIETLSRLNPDYLQFMNAKGFRQWEKIENFRKQIVAKNYAKIIEQGKSEGLVEDKPTIILITGTYGIVKSIVNPEFVLNNNFSFETAAKYAIGMVINACATEKGKQLFNKLSKGL